MPLLRASQSCFARPVDKGIGRRVERNFHFYNTQGTEYRLSTTRFGRSGDFTASHPCQSRHRRSRTRAATLLSTDDNHSSDAVRSAARYESAKLRSARHSASERKYRGVARCDVVQPAETSLCWPSSAEERSVRQRKMQGRYAPKVLVKRLISFALHVSVRIVDHPGP
jgi:hypothetical protein